MARSSDPKKLALWQGRFQRFLDSGLAVARFCAVEHVSESSFYYWQKKLGPQTLRRPARAEDCATRAEDRGVFRPVTVVPATCGVVVRLPGGTRIEVDAGQLDAIRAVVAEAVRVDHGQAADRNVSSDNQVIRGCGGTVSC
ncbi:MAG: hypothetical protein GY953_46035 [bacterium]|nr:hypothetical protein [bacterium]